MKIHTHTNFHIAAGKPIIAFLLCVLFGFAAKADFANPDFAFPATVREEALPEYARAIKDADGMTALLAANELTLSDKQISSDSLNVSLNRYREIARVCPQPYASLADLMQALLLSSAYNSNRYVYNHREIPESGEEEADPMLWSGAKFKSEISSLLERVLDKSDALAHYPLQDISPLIADSSSEDYRGMSCLDFAIYQIIDIVNSSGIASNSAAGKAIPFVRIDESTGTPLNDVSGSEKTLHDAALAPLNLINLLIKADEEGGADSRPLFFARVRKLNYISDSDARYEYGKDLLGLYPQGNRYRAELVALLGQYGGLPGNTPEDLKSQYALLEQTIKDNPDSDYVGCLKNQMQQIITPALNLHAPEQILSNTSFSIPVTISNLTGAHILLVPISYAQSDKNNLKVSQLNPIGKIIDAGVVSSAEKVPFTLSDTIRVSGLPTGAYAIVASEDSGLGGVYANMKKQNPALINVSDIAMIYSTGLESAAAPAKGKSIGGSSLPVVTIIDGRDSRPISGAKVTFKESGKKGRQQTLTTGADGSVRSPYERGNVIVSYKGSRLNQYVYNNGWRSDNSSKYVANILPDLALYHPGDTIKSVVVLGRKDSNILSPADGVKVTLHLMDANYKEVGSAEGVTSDMGRLSTSLLIPGEGLIGSFTLISRIDGKQCGSTSVQVADYKAPTFYIAVDAPEYKEDAVKLSGIVSTYSGMPVADSDVDLSISWSPRFRYFSTMPPSRYGTQLTTDAQGRFSVLLSTKELAPDLYANGVFSVSASAVSPAGETQSSNTRNFALGEGYSLSVNIPERIEVEGDSISFDVKVRDILGNPARKSVSYVIKSAYIPDRSPVSLKGEFISPSLNIPAKDLPSGTYDYQLTLAPTDTVSGQMIIWRKGDEYSPVEQPLWLPVEEIYAKQSITGESAQDNKIRIPVGSAFGGGMVYYQISDTASILKRGWLPTDGRMTELIVDAPGAGNKYSVDFYSMHNLKGGQGNVRVLPAENNIRLSVVPTTFRDKLSPGNRETWKFRIASSYGSGSEAAPVGGFQRYAVAAVMSNKALNDITPFAWQFNPERILSGFINGNLNFNYIGDSWAYVNFYNSIVGGSRCPSLYIPQWNTWGMQFGSRNIMIRGTMRKNAAFANGVAVLDEVLDTVTPTMARLDYAASKAEVAADESGVESADTGGAAADESSEDAALRSDECPLAFYQPMLLTDDNGNVDINFEIPNFNTTWALQLLAYDKNMRSVIGNYEAVASKPVMISANSPSFLLTGDKAQISSMVFNNSSEPLDITADIEISDPLTGKVLAKVEKMFDQVQPSASRLLSVEFEVPYDMSVLQLTARASSDKGSDGERTAITVLPSSVPVSDAYTFYFDAENTEAMLKLPKMNKGDMLTLNYCADPKWYVITALSGLLQPDSESALVIADALYANQLTSSIISAYPGILEGLRELTASDSDKAMLSPLSQNQNLKLTSLSSTPWVNNADNETLRMAALADYLNAGKCRKSIASMTEKLVGLQGAGGGWRWMSKMPESAFITRQVLSRLARLQADDVLPEDAALADAIRKAIDYSDKEMTKDYNYHLAHAKTPFPLASELGYMAMRSAFSKSYPAGIAKMNVDLLKRLPEEWKKLSLKDKIQAAEFLYKSDSLANGTLAKEIMSSVMQFASFSSQKGMWFAAVEEGEGSASSLQLASDAVRALRKIDPESGNIGKLMQYIILSRQTQDWQTGMSSSAAINVASSVMESSIFKNAGEMSVSSSAYPSVYVDGKRLAIEMPDGGIVGNVTLNLDPTEFSGKSVRIVGAPGVMIAWGGILSRRIQDVAKVKAQSVGQLKITKSLAPVELTSAGEIVGKPAVHFRKGDRIRVTLTIATDRELDYLLIRDNLGAFMQVQEQLAEYGVKDGVWMLSEPRTASQNFYITAMPKGKHVITYDVTAARDGEYSTGIAEVQSLYYPMISARSAGAVVNISNP